jgi:hypothetical protein
MHSVIYDFAFKEVIICNEIVYKYFNKVNTISVLVLKETRCGIDSNYFC